MLLPNGALRGLGAVFGCSHAFRQQGLQLLAGNIVVHAVAYNASRHCACRCHDDDRTAATAAEGYQQPQYNVPQQGYQQPQQPQYAAPPQQPQQYTAPQQTAPQQPETETRTSDSEQSTPICAFRSA